MTRAHRIFSWVLNLIVPGAGSVLLGRFMMGVCVGFLWGLLAGWTLVTAFVRPGQAYLTLASEVTLLAYLLAQLALWIELRARARLQSSDRDALFREALVAYVQGRLDESEKVCRALLHADPDDVEATLQLASIARRRNAPRLAKRHLARARYLDDAGRWDFEIERELAALGAEAGGKA